MFLGFLPSLKGRQRHATCVVVHEVIGVSEIWTQGSVDLGDGLREDREGGEEVPS